MWRDLLHNSGMGRDGQQRERFKPPDSGNRPIAQKAKRDWRTRGPDQMRVWQCDSARSLSRTTPDRRASSRLARAMQPCSAAENAQFFPAQEALFRRREGTSSARSGFLRRPPATGNRKFLCRRSPATLRFGFDVDAPLSWARLRFNADIRSTTGGGAVVGFAGSERPSSFASASSRRAS